MNRARLLVAGLAALLLSAALLVAILLAAPIQGRFHSAAQQSQQQTKKKEVKVWVNTASGVYHCPGTRWYGKTKRGKYMGECAAIKEGNRPAYGKACGSDCKN